jgi:SAM-dependent methyltransferase
MDTVDVALSRLFDSLDDEWEKNKLFGQQYFRYREILREVVRVPASGSVLEIGSGLGHISVCLAILGFKSTCVDIDVKRKDDSRWSGYAIPLLECDIERQELPLADASFDCVLFNDVLEHLMDDPVPTLKKMLRVLKPGGTLLLTTPNVLYFPLVLYPLLGKNVFPILEEYYQVPVRTAQREVYDRHNRLYTMKEVIHVVKRAGFEVSRRRFVACGEPVLKVRGKLAYTHRWSIRNLFTTDCLKKCLYGSVTALVPPWRSWIMVRAVRKKAY